jgi:hypothetical protein
MRKISMLTLILAGTLSSAAHAQLLGGNGSLGGGLGGNAGPVSGAIDGTLSGRGALHGDLPTRRTVGGVNEGSGRIADRTERLRERSAQRAERLRGRADATAIRTRDTAGGAASTAVQRGRDGAQRGLATGHDAVSNGLSKGASLAADTGATTTSNATGAAAPVRNASTQGEGHADASQSLDVAGRRHGQASQGRSSTGANVSADANADGNARASRDGVSAEGAASASVRAAGVSQVLPAAPCASLRDCFRSVRSRSGGLIATSRAAPITSRFRPAPRSRHPNTSCTGRSRPGRSCSH